MEIHLGTTLTIKQKCYHWVKRFPEEKQNFQLALYSYIALSHLCISPKLMKYEFFLFSLFTLLAIILILHRSSVYSYICHKYITVYFGVDVHAFFISNTFISNARLKLVKNLESAKQHTEAELLLCENYSLSSSMLSSKNNRRYSK